MIGEEINSPGSYSAGFSLIEILMIVLILGIIGTLVLPTFQSGLTKSKLSGAASEVTIALEYASLRNAYQRMGKRVK